MNHTHIARRVAVFGLGNMGFLIAERLARTFEVHVSDLDASSVERAVAAFGATPIPDVAKIGAVDTVVLSLPSPEASLAVISSLAPTLPKGSVIIETSTVNPAHVQRFAKALDGTGIGLIDASVMAGVSQMREGTAMLLVGGDPATVEARADVLDAIAPRRIDFGDLGTGAAAKVINNAVAHAVMVVVAEAGAMATAAGVSIPKLVALLSDPKMGLHRPLTHRLAERVVSGNYEGGMPLDAARKDSVLALELAQSLHVPIFAIQASHTVYEQAERAGLGREDYAAIAKLWAGWNVPVVPSQSQ